MKLRTRAALAAVLAVATASGAAAQTPPARVGDHYVPAPWWMQEPVIASLGRVRTEVTANRADFTVQFQVVERSAADATAAAADKVRALDAALRAYGADRIRVATTFSTRPLYEQYRDKDGNVQENRRADKIDRYEVSANVRLEVRDLAVLERAYATALAAKPTSVGPVGFRLEADNETNSWLYGEAVKDAARRAGLAVEGAGAKLGRVKVIDPTGRVCRTDVLAGWPSYGPDAPATDVVLTGARLRSSAPPPPPPPPADARGYMSEAAVQNMQVSLQPPRQWLEAEACVVYGLN